MINLICVGKIKEKYISDGINEYLKRLSKYTKLNIIEVENEEFNDIDKSLLKEAEKIVRYIDNKSTIVTLEIGGNEISSNELSSLIDKFMINGDITFVIGGSYGLHDNIKKLSNYKLSFSKLTFPHQLFRLIFLEQLYRSFKIIKNESYHK